MIQKLLIILGFFTAHSFIAQIQSVQDNFEGSGTINTWSADDCNMNTSFSNPFIDGTNSSQNVLEYYDYGGQYANVRFDVSENFDLSVHHTFTFKIYIESSSLTGTQNNQVSLKLQDGTLGAPWETQSEIIKNLIPDQWNEVTFDFLNDAFINFNAGSPDPIFRTDFNRVLIQVNGENNFDLVRAYIDDMLYDGTIGSCSTFNTLVWSDEFDGNGAIDNNKWFHQTFIPNGWGWFNGELQHYTNREDNSFVDNGVLHIVAKQETYTDPVQGLTKQYTSARLNSKFAFTYGRVEVRAKLPEGVGTWPAIWMLGKNINETGAYWQTQGFGTTSWPACGEIDIMEHWGSNQNYIQSALHTPSSSGGTVNHGGVMGNDVSNTFHVYAAEWSPSEIIFSMDGIPYYTYAPNPQNMSTWPFVADQYLLLNIAIQGSIDPSFSESEMLLDYVRVYQEGTSSTTIDTQIACESYTWIDGNTYTESNNTATFVLPNAEGCDSSIMLDLTINNADTEVDTQSACDSYIWIDGNTYTENNNTATWLLTNMTGCDSLIVLDLTLNPSSSSEINETVSDSYTLNGITYESSGTYTQTLSNVFGCDSIITLNLVVDPTLSINEQNPTVVIFPNPVQKTIQVQSEFTITAIRIVDAIGKTCWFNESPFKGEQTIDVSFLPPGIYSLRATAKSRVFEKGFVKL